MSTRDSRIQFTETLGSLGGASFEIALPAGIESEEVLFAAFEVAGSLPGYFGRNWDALEECLRDFHWVQADTIVIRHVDLPLSGNARALEVYVDVLRNAVSFWNATPGHSLVVFFPPSVEPIVQRLISKDQ